MPDFDSQPVISVRDFSFAIGGKDVLRQVSFCVQRGEYVSLVGPNGAGKTTLLKCLDRIHRGGSGEMTVCGRPLADYAQRELARHVSYVPQPDGRVPPFTVEQFVLLGRYPYLSPFSVIRREDRAAVRAAMQQTGTEGFASRLLQTLSGGERQQVYIAAALAQGAPILLLDEPAAFLDYRHQTEIRRLLRAVNRQQGVTVVAVTHDVNTAALDSDRVVALNAGQMVFCGTGAELMRPEVLQRIYDTSFLLVPHPETQLPTIVPGT